MRGLSKEHIWGGITINIQFRKVATELGLREMTWLEKLDGRGCCCSVTWSCPTFCDLMDCITPGFPVPHHLQKSTQVHVNCISDAILPCHPITPSSPSALNLFQHQGVFQWVSCSHQMTEILELQLQHQSFHNEYSGLFTFKTDQFDPLAVRGTLRCLLHHHSLKASILWCSAFFYGPALTTIHDHWEDHSLDSRDLRWQSHVSTLQHTVYVCHCFPSQKQSSSEFMAALTICSDFGAQEEEIRLCFLIFPFYLPWSNGVGCHDLSFFNI